MPIPDLQSLLLPVLRIVSNGELSGADLRSRLATQFNLSPNELAEKRGPQPVFANRVAWANVYLQQAGLIEKTAERRYRATHEGLGVLAENPAQIDLAFLQRFPKYAEWRRGNTSGGSGEPRVSGGSSPAIDISITPEEQIAKNYETLTAALELEVVERIREMSPGFFEALVIELLIKLGYGGGQPAMGRVTGKSGDGGIDGVIKEDALGLDIVYVQAKRYGLGHTVGQPEIRDFAGSLDGEGATKGIFITTGAFAAGAREYVSRIPKRIILIDGVQLARLMVEREVGVVISETYKLKKIDENYFVES